MAGALRDLIQNAPSEARPCPISSVGAKSKPDPRTPPAVENSGQQAGPVILGARGLYGLVPAPTAALSSRGLVVGLQSFRIPFWRDTVSYRGRYRGQD